MNNQKPQFYFLLILLATTLVLSFLILKPFLFAFTLAVVFAVLFQPLYRKMLKYFFHHEAAAALATVATILVLIFTPLLFVGAQILKEARDLYLYLAAGGGTDSIFNALNVLMNDFRERFPDLPEFSLNFGQYFQQGLSWFLANLGVVFSNFANIVATAFLFLISLYYLLKDGPKLRKKIIALSPLNDKDDETIIKRLELAMSSVVRGNLLIAIIQGTLTAIGFTIFGVPNAVLWGTAAAVAALIPTFGTSLVFIPTIIFLFVGGRYFSACGLALWGMLAVGLIDNLLGPKLIGRGMELHPLLILLSVLGGIVLFGPIGFLLGPIILSLLFALLDIYASFVNNKETRG
ncbi:MAG: AI-2E family transporter [Patescibacteria group bacterium]|nr:AI-2E family transporter [Patescibacteria group bacterium]